MPKVEEIKVLNVDDNVLAVDAQSEEVKALVATYNEWNQDLADRQKEHAQIRAAVQALSQQIIGTIRQEKEAAVQKAAAELEAAKVEVADNVTPIHTLPKVTEEVAAPAPVDAAPAPVVAAPVEAESLKETALDATDPEVTE